MRALRNLQPDEGVALYRQVFGWRLDEKRLKKTVKAYAPAVKVVDRR